MPSIEGILTILVILSSPLIIEPKKYRISRIQFWKWLGLDFLIIFCIGLIITYVFFVPSLFNYLLPLIFYIFLFHTAYLVIGRLHDMAKSGYWCYLTILLPVGHIILFIYCLKKGDNKLNVYGEVDTNPNYFF